MTRQQPHLRSSDGSVFPPVTPDPPEVPGAKVVDLPGLDDASERAAAADSADTPAPGPADAVVPDPLEPTD